MKTLSVFHTNALRKRSTTKFAMLIALSASSSSDAYHRAAYLWATSRILFHLGFFWVFDPPSSVHVQSTWAKSSRPVVVAVWSSLMMVLASVDIGSTLARGQTTLFSSA